MAFAPALGLLGAGISAFGAVESGIAQQHSANYQAQVAQNNAITANQNAVYSEHAGQTQATQASLKSAEKQARVKGALAANGIDVNSGSAVDVQESQREVGKLDTETTMANANLQAYGYRTQQAGFESQEKLDKATADNAVPGAILGATGGLLSNASAIGVKSHTFFNDIGSLF
jgi:opacity protein-like surface antigen